MTKLPLILDSTQITAFLECPRYWYRKHIQRLQLPTAFPRRRVMDIGSYGHKLLEIFYYEIASGRSRKDAIERSFSYHPEQVCECGHMEHFHKESSSDPILFDGLHCKFKKCTCETFTPTEALVSKKDEEFLRQRLLEYFAVYTNNDIRPHSPETVEVGFSYELYSSLDRIYILEGKIDIMGVYAQINSFTDHKFQARKHDLYDKSIQFRNYSLVTDYNMAFINYICLADKISSDTFKRVPIFFSPAERFIWRARLIRIYDKIFEFLRNAEEPQFWTSDKSDPNWAMCSGRYGHICEYTTLCEEINPGVVAAKVEQLYTIGKEWKPW